MPATSEIVRLQRNTGRNRGKVKVTRLPQGGHSAAWISSLNVLSCSDTQQRYGPMRRRRFIAIIACVAALPLAARAQQAVPSTAQAASTDISGCVPKSVGYPQRLDGPRWNGWGADRSPLPGRRQPVMAASREAGARLAPTLTGWRWSGLLGL